MERLAKDEERVAGCGGRGFAWRMAWSYDRESHGQWLVFAGDDSHPDGDTGRLRVRAGDRVAAGQPLARVGNSGNTTEPHLHIHAKRGGEPDSMLDGEGVPLRIGGRFLMRNDLFRGAS